MRFMIRHIDESAKLSDEARLEAIERAVPHRVLQDVVRDLGASEQRRRKLPADLTLLVAVGMNLFTHCSLHQVLIKLLKGLRLVWHDPDFRVATKSAICQARYRLGARPVVELFHRVCRPMATPATPGAFLFGLRLMAIDGLTEDVPDTPENARVFGRPSGARGDGAFPQVLAVHLVECGTHAIVDSGLWPCHSSVYAGALRLLRSVTKGMLLMWDTGLHSFDMATRTLARDAHFLGRVPAAVKFQSVQHLPDGTFLTYIRPSDHHRRKRGERLLVRVIEYILTDPNRPGYNEKHRLMTSLLDTEQYPALDLVCAYHERWEAELVIDETDTHQRLPYRPLRSQRPVAVVQEFYGLLIAHYAVRYVMHDAALQAGIDPDRLSFTNALAVICDSIHEFQMVDSVQHSVLYQRLLRDIARHRLPERDNRINPRVVRRKIFKYRVKRKEHEQWPQPLQTFREAVALLN